jgi:lipopolysaccharide transport system permease protein
MIAGEKDTAADSIAPTIIRASGGWVKVDFGELWRYRELLAFLTWRDLIVRYKQAVFGAGWAVLQPLVTMIVFTIVFSKIAKIQPDSGPYAIFSFAALVPWQFFANVVQRSGISLVTNANLLTKVYFPRLVIPLSSALALLVDLTIAFVVLLVLMPIYHVSPTWNALWLPLFCVLALVSAVAVSLWLTALNVLYRDIQYVIPLLVQIWMYVSPVIYPVSKVPAKWQWVYGLNPMASVIQGFRWGLLGAPAPGRLLVGGCAMTLAILVGGLAFFRRTERIFADVV